MPNLRSSFKRVRVSAKKAAQNRPIRSAARNAVSRAERVIESDDPEAARASVLQAISTLDKAVSKGILHKNNAARRKSRLVKRLVAATSTE